MSALAKPVMFHLVCGSTGAGKTTYSVALAEREGGVHFAIDEWMATLFGPEAPATPDFGWIVARVGRCEAQIARMALRLAARGTPSVLDLGFLRAADRTAFAARLGASGYGIALHALDVPADIRWQRVSGRNNDKGATFSFEVTRPMFDFIETIWEPPTDAELAAGGGIRIAA